MSKLKIAIQKNGRLHDESLKLLKDCGISVNNGRDQLKVVIDNFPLEILYLRNSDIPQYIEDGTADIGIVGENLLFEKQKKVDVVEKLVFRIKAVLRAKNSKYILLNVPNEKIKAVTNILPVLKSPTILPLAQEGWSSLHSVIDENKFWEVIDELKTAGAEDILIVPIDKMVI